MGGLFYFWFVFLLNKVMILLYFEIIGFCFFVNFGFDRICIGLLDYEFVGYFECGVFS